MVWAAFVAIRFCLQQPAPFSTILDSLVPQDNQILPSFAALATYATGCLGTLALFLCALGAGNAVLSRWIRNDITPLERVALSGAIGYGVLAYVTLAMGYTGLYQRALLRGVIAIGAVLSGAGLYRGREHFAGVAAEARGALFSGGIKNLLGLGLLFVFATDAVMTLVPELFYDAQVYHLGVPNFYLLEHRLAPIDVMPAKFPFAIQMIYVLGLALKNEIVTKQTHFIFLLLLTASLLTAGRRLGSRAIGIAAAVLFVTIPTMQINVWSSGVDAGVSLFGFLAFAAFFRSLRDDGGLDGRWLALSGLFAGFCVGSKYTGVFVPLVVGLMIVGTSLREPGGVMAALRRGTLFSVMVALPVVPWLLKNWFETGNPVYPFLPNFFPGAPLEPWRYLQLKGENRGLAVESLRDLILVPWKLTMNERSSLSFQGPMFLMAIPFVGLLRWKNLSATTRTVLVAAAIFIPIGLGVTRLTRYLLPGLTLVALALGVALGESLDSRNGLQRWAALGTLSIAAFLQLTWCYVIINNSYGPRDVLLGRESRLAYMSRAHPGQNPNPSVPMYIWMGDHLPPSARVLIFGEEKGYPMPVRHAYSGVYDVNPLVRFSNESRTAEELTQKLRHEGFTHLMVSVYEVHRLADYGILAWTDDGFRVFSDFWNTFLKLNHVEYGDVGNGYKNPLLLFDISSTPVEPTPSSKVDNLIAPIYQKFRTDHPVSAPAGRG